MQLNIEKGNNKHQKDNIIILSDNKAIKKDNKKQKKNNKKNEMNINILKENKENIKEKSSIIGLKNLQKNMMTHNSEVIKNEIRKYTKIISFLILISKM